jgi:Tfp pilus assembly protein PilX
MSEIRVLDVNQETLDLFQAPDKPTLLCRLNEVFRDDMERFSADKEAAKRSQRSYRILSLACLAVLLVNLVISIMNLTGAIRFSSTSTNIITVAALLAPIWFRNRMADQMGKRYGAQFAALSGAGASVPLAMIDRFVLDRAQQRIIYSDLLTTGSASVGNLYRVTINTSNKNKYVVRVVQAVPADAAIENVV